MMIMMSETGYCIWMVDTDRHERMYISNDIHVHIKRMYAFIHWCTGCVSMFLDFLIGALSTTAEHVVALDARIHKWTDTRMPVLPVPRDIGSEIGRLWALIQYQFCGAYMFNGVGISYKMAEEILSIRAKFDVMSTEHVDLDGLYKEYIHQPIELSNVVPVSPTIDTRKTRAIQNIFLKMRSLGCTSVDMLTIKRTYSHPCFGEVHGDVTIYEMETDARLTMHDLSHLLLGICHCVGKSRQVDC